jgi:hypothetical protein
LIAFRKEKFTVGQSRKDKRQTSRLCRRLALNLLQRNCRQYVGIVTAIFIGHWRMERWRVRLIRVSYLYFRYLDDVADGDRECPTGPNPLLDQQLSRWRSGWFESDSTHEVNLLFGYLWNEFKERSFPLSSLRLFGLSIIKGLQLDLERRLERRVLRRAELDAYYGKVILAPAQLAHTILKARVIPPALQEISIVIGRLQSARDLESDWMRGLINIPRGDLGNPDYAAQVTLPREIETWRAHEIDRCSTRLRAIWQRWRLLADDRSRALMKPAVGTLLNWASKQPRGYQTFSNGNV